MNINLSGSRNETDVFGQNLAMNIFSGNMTVTFLLPKHYILDIDGYYMSPWLQGNATMSQNPMMDASLRKQFFNKKLTASIFANNLFDSAAIRLKVREKDFQRNSWNKVQYRTFGISLNYSFQSGKSVQVKNVQSGAAEEKARLQ